MRLVGALALLAGALAALPTAARAQLTLSINNHTCATLMVSLADAPGCGPDVPACSVLARNGFTTKLPVQIAYRPGFLTLAASGGCGSRNTTIAGTCQVEVKTVRETYNTGLSYYRNDTSRPEQQSASPTDLRDLTISIPRPATLVSVDIYQGICDTDEGERRCELFCRTPNQQ
ncbi:MAG: hypothetical protein IT562_25430 [Alphaproteobacteria bacterium]|nr:hypothetical protein [Alphaproteobacteria bacterium]